MAALVGRTQNVGEAGDRLYSLNENTTRAGDSPQKLAAIGDSRCFECAHPRPLSSGRSAPFGGSAVFVLQAVGEQEALDLHCRYAKLSERFDVGQVRLEVRALRV